MKTVILAWGKNEINKIQVEDNQFEFCMPVSPPNAMGLDATLTPDKSLCKLVFSYCGRQRVCECGKTSFEVFELTKVKIGTCGK